MKSHWKRSENYRFSRSATQNPLRPAAMVTNISDDFEPPSKKNGIALVIIIFKDVLLIEYWINEKHR